MVAPPLQVFDQDGERGGKEGGGRGGGGKEGKMKQMKPKTPLMGREGKGGAQVVKRGRGRPRLTEEEKQRRKELRDLGLMKRSHRRSKEGQHLLLPCTMCAVSHAP